MKYNYGNALSFCEINSKIYILHEATSNFFCLEKVGFLFWKKIYKMDLAQCIEEIVEYYQQPVYKIERDLTDFAKKLVQYGLLVEGNE